MCYHVDITITQNNQLDVANSFATIQESKPVKQRQSFRNIKKNFLNNSINIEICNFTKLCVLKFQITFDLKQTPQGFDSKLPNI